MPKASADTAHGGAGGTAAVVILGEMARTATSEGDDAVVTAASASAATLVANIGNVVQGKDEQIRLIVAALACKGHVLLEDVPGTAKTVLARVARGLDRGRDRLADPVHARPAAHGHHWAVGLEPEHEGVRVQARARSSPTSSSSTRSTGRLPKAQSALLEGMAEHQVTVDGVTHALPDPFFVVATENTIEQEGTFPLPEAQLDRFLIRTSLGYPSLEEELAIVEAQLHGHPLDDLGPVIGVGELADVFAAVEEIYIDPLLKQWAVELVRSTRSDDAIEVGASVRGSLALERMARARALVQGRDYVIADDIERLFGPVVGHRLILSADALIGSDASESDLLDGILAACLERVPRPEPNWEAGAAPEGQ